MIKQKVLIINFNSLYEILNEIKETLPFEIIKNEKEGHFFKDINFDKKNTLIITKSNNKLNIETNLDDKNILNFFDYPILIIKLIELINIQLIKIKFNYQSKINIVRLETVSINFPSLINAEKKSMSEFLINDLALS